MRSDLRRRLTAEAIGTAMLLAAVVGSGIMGDRLSPGIEAIALLANTVATAAALVALILTFAPISGGHFNPAVSVADASQGGLPLAGGSCLRRGADRRRGSRRVDRACDVRRACVDGVAPCTERARTDGQRVRSHVRSLVGDLGMFAAPIRCGSLRGSGLYRRRVLVHGVDVVRESRRYPSASADGYLRRHSSGRRAWICRCAVCRRRGCDAVVSVARAGVTTNR
jgi:hypothetical protein